MLKLKKSAILTISYLLFMTGIADKAFSRPENIKPGLSYYADEFSIKNNITKLGEEKNYEEVFKNYRYYEAIYDEQKRPSIFRAYKRGEITWSERYFYNSDGKLIKKETMHHGKPPEIIRFDSKLQN